MVYCLMSLKWGGVISAVINYISAAQSFILAIPYYIMGIFLAKRPFLMKKNHELIVITIIGLFVLIEGYFCRHLYLRGNATLCIIPFVTFTVHFLICHHIDINSSVAQFTRKMSILIYLLHPIIIWILQNTFLYNLGFHLFITTITLSILLAFIIVWLSNYVAVLKKLY